MMITPEPTRVGERAGQILRATHAHPGYERPRSSSLTYSTWWATFTGYPLISRWSLERDAGGLLGEAPRALALTAAVVRADRG